MSQRYFRNERYEVFTGWDRPLHSFFMVIEDHTLPDADEVGMVYSNLSDAKGPALSFDRMQTVLHQFNITPPETLWRDLQKDKHADAGNLVVHYRFVPTFPAVPGCICNPHPTEEDPCFCSDLERALRAYGSGAISMPAMTDLQREYCLEEIASVEGYERQEYETVSDAVLASGVLHAWTDYCRDKGLL